MTYNIEKISPSLLIINRRSPYESALAKSSLDIALTSQIFSLPTSVVFCDDGVFQLLSHKNTEAIDHPNLSEALQELQNYDIKDCYVLEESLQARKLNMNDLVIDCHLISAETLKSLLLKHKYVISL